MFAKPGSTRSRGASWSQSSIAAQAKFAESCNEETARSLCENGKLDILGTVCKTVDMREMNSERALVELLREVCAVRGIRLAAFSDDWVFCLQKGGRTTYVFGYDFSLNSATAKRITNDKAATSDLLQFHGVPRIEHRIFHSPQLAEYVPLEGNWRTMLEYFEACGGDVVCKPNQGSGGKGVSRARTPQGLEAAVIELFRTQRSLCLCPFEPIEHEFRVAILRGQIEFVYRKRRLVVVGDGQRTLRALLLEKLANVPDFGEEAEGLANLSEMQFDFAGVPDKGEEVALNWKHNLGQGAEPELLDMAETGVQQVCELAVQAAAVMDVALASVDVVQSGGKLRVLEINAGIMMESLVRSAPEGRNIARRFYDRIICDALEIEPLNEIGAN